MYTIYASNLYRPKTKAQTQAPVAAQTSVATRAFVPIPNYTFERYVSKLKAKQRQEAWEKQQKALSIAQQKDINSLADVIFGTFGDMNRLPFLGLENIPILNIIPSTLTWANNQFIKPFSATNSFGQNALILGTNLLTGLGEDIDSLNNIVKGVAQDGVREGIANNFALGDKGRVNYTWKTGSLAADIALEIITDPFTWMEVAATIAAYINPIPGDEVAMTGIVATHLSSKIDDIIKSTGKVFKGTIDDFAEVSIKESGALIDDVTNHYSKQVFNNWVEAAKLKQEAINAQKIVNNLSEEIVQNMSYKTKVKLSRAALYKRSDEFTKIFLNHVSETLNLSTKGLTDPTIVKAVSDAITDVIRTTYTGAIDTPILKAVQKLALFENAVSTLYLKTLGAPVYVPYKLNKEYHILDKMVNNRVIRAASKIPRTTELGTIDVYNLDEVVHSTRKTQDLLNKAIKEQALPVADGIDNIILTQETELIIDNLKKAMNITLSKAQKFSAIERAAFIRNFFEETFNMSFDEIFEGLAKLDNPESPLHNLITEVTDLMKVDPEYKVYALRGYIKKVSNAFKDPTYTRGLVDSNPEIAIKTVNHIIQEETGLRSVAEFIQLAKEVDPEAYENIITRLTPYTSAEEFLKFKKRFSTAKLSNLELRNSDELTFLKTFTPEELNDFMFRFVIPALKDKPQAQQAAFLRLFLEQVPGYEKWLKRFQKARTRESVKRALNGFNIHINKLPKIDYSNNPLYNLGESLYRTSTKHLKEVTTPPARTPLIERFLNIFNNDSSLFVNESTVFENIVKKLLPPEIQEQITETISASDLYLKRLIQANEETGRAFDEFIKKFKAIKTDIESKSLVKNNGLSSELKRGVSEEIVHITELSTKFEKVQTEYNAVSELMGTLLNLETAKPERVIKKYNKLLKLLNKIPDEVTNAGSETVENIRKALREFQSSNIYKSLKDVPEDVILKDAQAVSDLKNALKDLSSKISTEYLELRKIEQELFEELEASKTFLNFDELPTQFKADLQTEVKLKGITEGVETILKKYGNSMLTDVENTMGNFNGKDLFNKIAKQADFLDYLEDVDIEKAPNRFIEKLISIDDLDPNSMTFNSIRNKSHLDAASSKSSDDVFSDIVYEAFIQDYLNISNSLQELLPKIYKLSGNETLTQVTALKKQLDEAIKNIENLDIRYKANFSVNGSGVEFLKDLSKELDNLAVPKNTQDIILQQGQKVMVGKVNNMYLANMILSSSPQVFNEQIPKIIEYITMKLDSLAVGEAAEKTLSEAKTSLINTLAAVKSYQNLLKNLDAINPKDVPEAVKTIVLDTLAYKFFLDPQDILRNAQDWQINNIIKDVRKQMSILSIKDSLSMDNWRLRTGRTNAGHIAITDVLDMFERAFTDYPELGKNNPVLQKMRRFTELKKMYVLAGWDIETTGTALKVSEIVESSYCIWGGAKTLTQNGKNINLKEVNLSNLPGRAVVNTRKSQTFLTPEALTKLYVQGYADEVTRATFLKEQGPLKFMEKFVYPNAPEVSEFEIVKPLLDEMVKAQSKGKTFVLMTCNGNEFDINFLRNRLNNVKDIIGEEQAIQYFKALKNTESFDILQEYQNVFSTLKMTTTGEDSLRHLIADYITELATTGEQGSGLLQLIDKKFITNLRELEGYIDELRINKTLSMIDSDVLGTIKSTKNTIYDLFKNRKDASKSLSNTYFYSSMFDIDDIVNNYGRNLSQIFYCTMQDGVISVNSGLRTLGYYSYALDDVVHYFDFKFGDAVAPHRVKYFGQVAKSIKRTYEMINDVSVLHTEANQVYIDVMFSDLQEYAIKYADIAPDYIKHLTKTPEELNTYEKFAILHLFRKFLPEDDVNLLQELWETAKKPTYSYDINPAYNTITPIYKSEVLEKNSEQYLEYFKNKVNKTEYYDLPSEDFNIQKYEEVFSEENMQRHEIEKAMEEAYPENRRRKFAEKVDNYIARYTDTIKYAEDLDNTLSNFKDFTEVTSVFENVSGVRAAVAVKETLRNNFVGFIQNVRKYYMTLDDKSRTVFLNQQCKHMANVRLSQTMQFLDLLTNPANDISTAQAHMFFNAHRLAIIPVEGYATHTAFQDAIQKLMNRSSELAENHIRVIPAPDGKTIYVTLDEGYKVTRVAKHERNVQYFVNGEEIFRPILKDLDLDSIYKLDAVDNLDEAEMLKFTKEINQKLSKVTNGRHVGSAYENTTRELYVQLYQNIPDDVRKTLPDFDEFTNEKFFTNVEYNHSILGDADFRRSFGNTLLDENEKPLLYTYYNLTDGIMENAAKAFNNADKKIQYLNFILDDSMNLAKGKAWAKLSDEQIFLMYKQTDSYKVVTLTDRIIPIAAKEGDHFADFKLVEFKINSPADVAKAREIGASIIPTHVYNKAHSVINEFEYMEGIVGSISKVVNLFKMGYLISVGNVVKNTIDEFTKNVIDQGGFTEATTSVAYATSTYFQFKKATQAIIKAYDEVTDDTIAMYFKQVYAGTDSFNEGLYRLVYNFLEDGPVGQIDEVLNTRLTGVELTAYGQMTKIAQKLLEPTSEVDRVMRLSEYLWAIKNGYNTLDAYALVEHTHFAFSKKSEFEKLAEIVFPFYGFTIDNLHYWLETLEKHPSYIRHYLKLQNVGTNYWDPTGEKRKYNLSYGAAITSGQLIVGKNGETLKIAPSFFDVIQLFTNPANWFESKLAGYIKEPINALQHLIQGTPYNTNEKAQAASNLIPLIGPLPQRILTGKRNLERTGNVLTAVVPSLFGGIKTNKRQLKQSKGYTKRYYPKKVYPKVLYPKKAYNKAQYKNSTKFKKYNSYWSRNRYYNSYKKYYSNYYPKHYWSNLPKRMNYRVVRNTYYDLYSKSGKSRLAIRGIPTTSKNLHYKLKEMQRYFR